MALETITSWDETAPVGLPVVDSWDSEPDGAANPARMTLTRGGQSVLEGPSVIREPQATGAALERHVKTPPSWQTVLQTTPDQLIASGKKVLATAKMAFAEEAVQQNIEGLKAATSATQEPETIRGQIAATQIDKLHKAVTLRDEAKGELVQADEFAKVMIPPDMSLGQEAYHSAIASAPPMLAGIAAAIVTKNPALAYSIGAGGGGLMQGVSTYGEATEKGAPHRAASLSATIDAVLETVGERLTLGAALAPGSPIGLRIVKAMIIDMGQEATTQATQDFHAWATYNPELTLADAFHNLQVAALAGAGTGLVVGGAGHVVAGQDRAATAGYRAAGAIEDQVAGTAVPRREATAGPMAAAEPGPTTQPPVIPRKPTPSEVLSGVEIPTQPVEKSTVAQPAGTEAPSAPYQTPETLYDWAESPEPALPQPRSEAIGQPAIPEARPEAAAPVAPPAALELPEVPEAKRWDGKVTQPGKDELVEPFPDIKPPKVTSLLQKIKDIGGIDPTYAQDLTGESKMGAKGVPVGLFRKGSKGGFGGGLDSLATQLEGEGWDIRTNDTDGGVATLTRMIQDELAGNKHYSFADTERVAAYERDLRARQEAQDFADQAALPKWVPEVGPAEVRPVLQALGYEDGGAYTIADLTLRAAALDEQGAERLAIQSDGVTDAQYAQELWRFINERTGKQNAVQNAAGTARLGEAAQPVARQVDEITEGRGAETEPRLGERDAGEQDGAVSLKNAAAEVIGSLAELSGTRLNFVKGTRLHTALSNLARALMDSGVKAFSEGQAQAKKLLGKAWAKARYYFREAWGYAKTIQPGLSIRDVTPGGAKSLLRAKGFIAEPARNVPQGIGERKLPTHVNYNRIDTAQDVKEALARLSEQFEADIQKQRRGTVSWEQTYKAAEKDYANLMGIGTRKAATLIKRVPGTAAAASELWARKELALGMVEELMRRREALVAKGAAASTEDMADFAAHLDRTGMVAAQFIGASAETGRALNILKSSARAGSKIKAVNEIISLYQGPESLLKIAKMLGDLNDPTSALGFAAQARRATTWDMIIEAWKAGLVSGVITHQVNVASNLLFAGTRIPERIVASLAGNLHRGPDKVYWGESIALTLGMVRGAFDGLKTAGHILRHGQDYLVVNKAEQPYRKAISAENMPAAWMRSGATGKAIDVAGEAIRLPYRLLSAEDQFFRTMNERGELWALAVRKARQQGTGYLDTDFLETVVGLAQNPSEDMLEAATQAGLRYTFNLELGTKGKAFQEFVRTVPALQVVFPFIRTPGNIFKENARMIPGGNLLVDEWNQDFAAGGSKRDAAIAEVVVGTSVMTLFWQLAAAGFVSGGGDENKEKKRAMREAGWQPYSIKIGDKWYSYQRLEPVSTLVGLTADASELYKYMSKDEHDKWARMLGFAFANNVTNKTYLRGFSDLVNMISDPERYGENYWEAIAGSVVPGVLGQWAQLQDPQLREVHGMLEAIRSRVPETPITPEFNRQSLAPRFDLWGEPISSADRAWPASFVTVTQITGDQVRAEAARLGVNVGMPSRKVYDVKLDPQNYGKYVSLAGKPAHEVLAEIMADPGWNELPDWQKSNIVKTVVKKTRPGARVQMLDEVGMIEPTLQRLKKQGLSSEEARALLLGEQE